MSYMGLYRVKRGDKYTENIIYVLDYTPCQDMYWILRFSFDTLNPDLAHDSFRPN